MNKNWKLLSGFVVVLVVGVLAYIMFFSNCTVTFDSRMGTSIKAEEVKKGGIVSKPNDPVMDGYTFLGWFLDDEEFNFDTKITKNITLVGKWEKVK